MALPQPSDETIIDQDKNRFRAQVQTLATLFGSFLALSAIGGVFLLAQRAHVFPAWLADTLTAAFLLLAVVVVFTSFNRNHVYLSDAAEYLQDENYLRKTIDMQHLRWRIQIAFLLFNLVVIAGVLTSTLLGGPQLTPPVALFAISYVLVAVAGGSAIAFGPGFMLPHFRRALNDELTRAQQAKAVRLGFFLAIAAMGGVLIAAICKPLWGIAALPGALAAAIILPGIYFLTLQWLSGRDG